MQNTVEMTIVNEIVNSVKVSVDYVYDGIDMFGFERSVELQAKQQMYTKFEQVAEYLDLPLSALSRIVDSLYRANKARFLNQAVASFQAEYA